VFHYFTRGATFSPKITPSLRESNPPFNTWYLWPTRVIIPNDISIGSAVFVWVPNAMLYKNCAFPLGLRHPAGGGPSHGHRQHAQKFGKGRACTSGDILANRQTERHTDILITILRKGSCGQINKYLNGKKDWKINVLIIILKVSRGFYSWINLPFITFLVIFN